MLNENNTGCLFKKNKQGKILVWSATYIKATFIGSIHIEYGQYGGKIQKEITNVEPKANRTLDDQLVLEITSLYNKQRDKGYKSSKDLGIIMAVHEEGDEYYTTNIEGDKRKWGTEIEAVEALLPNEVTDANGYPKPMKCTPIEKAWKKVKYPCLVQPKLDGVRCFILHNGEKWVALSSSGKSYDVAARYILHSLELIEIDKNLILDGELYIHGTPLQTISGWCRKQESIPEHNNLEFHLFDIARSDIPFEDRYLDAHTVYQQWIDKFATNEHCSHLFKKVIEVEASNEQTIREVYTEFVEMGYEGAIIRNFDLGYEFGRRSTNIFKLKDFKDEEFKIVGIEAGKRGSEDLTFICETWKDGVALLFHANPIGTREQKAYWWNNRESWFHKQGTVRYLTLSNDGIPTGNPVLKAIRDYE